MFDMGLILLTNQAMSVPEDLLNLSLNAKAILPEGFVLLALIGTLLVDLAGEETARKWSPPICYAGLGAALCILDMWPGNCGATGDLCSTSHP